MRLTALSALGAVTAAAVLSVASHARPPDAGTVVGPRGWRAISDQLVDIRPLQLLLWPFRWVVAPFLATDSRTFLLSLGPALVMPACLYAWIVRMEVQFEEGSIALSEKRAEMRAAWKAGRRYRAAQAEPAPRRDPFRLGGCGRPELRSFGRTSWLSNPGST